MLWRFEDFLVLVLYFSVLTVLLSSFYPVPGQAIPLEAGLPRDGQATEG